ncbi:hypothetical protein AFV9_gp34 [Betalipothrixvirus uzonense]|uniref:Uncharacterized protein n=1 Tax=Betalipothrixvirus uzonense TaxID=512792 RepID=B2CRL1_9VIRU|nr:hypothetical protein AFV9_gp34 [Acidianus filamentous virus 9]ACB37268.1 hypothetical protein [Acidianus filamentous virus 9]
MMIRTKTELIRWIFITLASMKGNGIKFVPYLVYELLDNSSVSSKVKERILIYTDQLETGKITPREYARLIFLEYPKPTRTGRILRYKVGEAVTLILK